MENRDIVFGGAINLSSTASGEIEARLSTNFVGDCMIFPPTASSSNLFGLIQRSVYLPIIQNFNYVCILLNSWHCSFCVIVSNCFLRSFT